MFRGICGTIRHVFPLLHDRMQMGDIMRIGRKERLAILICTVIIPTVLCAVIYPVRREREAPVSYTEEVTVLQESVPYNDKYMIRLLEENGTVTRIPLEEYLVGVVLKEMPANFAGEALKAQAVAARTYTLRRSLYQSKHTNADVCTDPACCQAFAEEDEYLQRGGSTDNIDLVRAAVTETEDLVMIYAGRLIEATYFSSSGGMTESAVAVWGSDVPYLQSVKSPGEESAEGFAESRFFSCNELESALGIKNQGSTGISVTDLHYTQGQGIETVIIEGKKFTGVELRKLLKLRSTSITLHPTGDGLTVVTKGYGHRVGMSQYGADAMARNGSNFKEILLYYYSGVTICSRLDAGIKDSQ